MKRICLLLLTLAVIGTCEAQSIKAAACVGATMPKLKRLLGAPAPQAKSFKYIVFQPAGFDQVLVDAPGAHMKRIELTFSRLLAGRVALGYLGLQSKGTKIRVINVASSPSSPLRNATEFTGVGGVPSEPSKGPWRVFYQEVATLNKSKLATITPRLSGLSEKARINAVRSCYDWHSEIMLFAPSAVPSVYAKS